MDLVAKPGFTWSRLKHREQACPAFHEKRQELVESHRPHAVLSLFSCLDIIKCHESAQVNVHLQSFKDLKIRISNGFCKS